MVAAQSLVLFLHLFSSHFIMVGKADSPPNALDQDGGGGGGGDACKK